MTHGMNVRFHPGSRTLPNTRSVEECAIFWPAYRPTGAVGWDHAPAREAPLESDTL